MTVPKGEGGFSRGFLSRAYLLLSATRFESSDFAWFNSARLSAVKPRPPRLMK